MKKFSKQIDERLKLTKDTKLIKGSSIDINDINKHDRFKCVTVGMPNYKFNGKELFDWDLVCDENPDKISNDVYTIKIHWEDTTDFGNYVPTFTIYYSTKIQFPYLCCFNKSRINDNISGIFILFKTIDDAQIFVNDYDKLYKDEMPKLYKEAEKTL